MRKDYNELVKVLSPVSWQVGDDGDGTSYNSEENERSFHYYHPSQHHNHYHDGPLALTFKLT